MKKFMIIAAIVLGAIVVLGGITGLSMWSWVGGFYDSANTTRIAAQSRDKEAQAVYDKTWKTISDKAKISAKYADDFKQIFIGGNEARYKGKDNMMMMWITEHNPTLDPSITRELSQSVEAQRNEYLSIVKAQISIAQEHNTKVTSSGSFIPCTILRIVGHPNKVCDTVGVRQVTSTRTQNAFESGKDDNVELFDNK